MLRSSNVRARFLMIGVPRNHLQPSSVYKSSLPGFMNVREIRLQLLADARKVCVDRIQFNVVTHPDGVKAECVSCRFYGEVVKAD